MGALASWTPESGLLTAPLYPAFQKEAARAGKWRRDGSGGGGRGWRPPKWPGAQSIIPAAAPGGERKELDMCGSGMAGPVRGWPKVTSSGDTERGFKHALGTSAC